MKTKTRGVIMGNLQLISAALIMIGAYGCVFGEGASKATGNNSQESAGVVKLSTSAYNIDDEMMAYYNNLNDFDKKYFNGLSKDEKILFMLDDEVTLNKSFINMAIPVLIKDIRRRIKEDDLPSKEGEDYTFRTLGGLLGDLRIFNLFLEIIETCKSEEGVSAAISAIVGPTQNISNRNEQIAKTIKTVLDPSRKLYSARLHASGVLYRWGYKDEAYPVYKEIAQLERLDDTDKYLGWGLISYYKGLIESKYHSEAERKSSLDKFNSERESLILSCMENIVNSGNKDIIKILHKISVKGATDKIKAKALEYIALKEKKGK